MKTSKQKIKKSPLLAKIKFEPIFFQVLWQFFNPKGSLLWAGGRGGWGKFRPPSPLMKSVRIFSNRHRQQKINLILELFFAGGGTGIRTLETR